MYLFDVENFVSDLIDLGTGVQAFRSPAGDFCVDLVGWTVWYMEVSPGYTDKQGDMVRAVQERLYAEVGVQVNQTLADAFLNAIWNAYLDLKKKQQEERKSRSSTESTPSE